MKMPTINLTEGAIMMISTDETLENYKPVLQVTDIRFVRMENQIINPDLYWIQLSDGSSILRMMLDPRRNDLVLTRKLQTSSIVMLTELDSTMIQNRRIIIIVDLGVILEKCDFIGELQPDPIKTNVSSMTRATPPVQSMNQTLSLTGAQSYGSGLPTSREMVLAEMKVHKTIKQIKDENLGMSEKPDFVTLCARITSVDIDNFCYPSCPIMTGDRKCSIMLKHVMGRRWRCIKCHQVVNDCDYPYTLRIQIQDCTGSTWVTAFEETGEEIMGVSAKDLYEMKNYEENEEKFFELVKNVHFREFMFKLKLEKGTIYGMEVVEWTIVKAVKVNTGTETTYLPDHVAKLKEEDSGSLTPKDVDYVNTTQETGVSATQKACLDPKF